MITTITSLVNNEEQPDSIFSDFCPIFTDKEKAVEYAKHKTNNENYLKVAYCHTDDKGNIIVHGDYWIMAVIPIFVNGEQYYEVTKAANLFCPKSTIPCENERLYIVPQFEGFQGKELSNTEKSRLWKYEIDSEGNIFKDGVKYAPDRVITPHDKSHFQMWVNIKVHKESYFPLSHLMWAAFVTQNYDVVKLMTSHIAAYCPEYLITTDKQLLDILELRNAGWQWSIDHINNNPADNAIDNLQMCTLQANNKLRDIRKKLPY